MIDDYLGAVCECGGAWFDLVPAKSDDGGLLVPGFCLSSEGEIVGWAGDFACIECGQRWSPDAQPDFPSKDADVVPLSSARLRRFSSGSSRSSNG